VPMLCLLDIISRRVRRRTPVSLSTELCSFLPQTLFLSGRVFSGDALDRVSRASPGNVSGFSETDRMGIHEEVTNRTLLQLERGTAPWVKPWPLHIPYNAATSRRYSGVNVFLLWDTPYEHPAWPTFEQAQALGGHVRKGERSTQIVSDLTFPNNEDDETAKRVNRIPVITRYFVLNVEQVDGLPCHCYTAPPEVPGETVGAFLSAINADIRHGGPWAYYDPDEDYVRVPHPERFTSLERYHAAWLHEMLHWTGHPSRLDRRFDKEFGDYAHIFEELVAELGSAFLSAELGICTELHHANYTRDWVHILHNHRQAIFMASARATYAAAYLKQLQEEEATGEERKATVPQSRKRCRRSSAIRSR
jgi:antirestriction protein ArdC